MRAVELNLLYIAAPRTSPGVIWKELSAPKWLKLRSWGSLTVWRVISLPTRRALTCCRRGSNVRSTSAKY